MVQNGGAWATVTELDAIILLSQYQGPNRSNKTKNQISSCDEISHERKQKKFSVEQTFHSEWQVKHR